MEISKEQLVQCLNSKFTNDQLAAYFNCGVSTIKRAKTKFSLVGYKTNSKPLTTKQVECIEQLAIQGKSLQQVCQKTGLSAYIIKKYVPESLYSRILVNCKETFIQNKLKARIDNIFIPNEESAYICGVLQSDGYLTSDNYIGLTTKDKDFVLHFAKFFNTNVNEVLTKDNKLYYQAKFKDIRNVEKFKAVTNIYPNKTYSNYTIPEWIKANDAFLLSFIVGVFNGDGWVSVVKDRNNTCEVGIEQHRYSGGFLQEINKLLKWNFYINDATARISSKNHSTVHDFYTWYALSEFALLRKVSVLDTIHL